MTSEFSEFWQTYPRKQKRAAAQIMWNRLSEDEKRLAIAALPNHVAYWLAKNGGDTEYIPLAASWLNPRDGRRWEDELEVPKKSRPENAWWTNEIGVQRKARELGLSARPGESMETFKARIREAA